MKSKNVYICGTPIEHCNGSPHHGTGWQKNRRFHASRSEASKCYRQYLTRVIGCKRIASNQYAPPDGGPVLLVTRESKYGAKMKCEPEKGAGRYAAEDNHGVIVG